MKSRALTAGFALLLAAATGCESTRWNWIKPTPNNEVAAKKGGAATVEDYVSYLNANASRVKSLRVDDLSVDASMGSQSFGLPAGILFVESPRNFRMQAKLLGKTEVDIGSNAQEFWFWAQRNPDPYQYFCSYQDLNAGKVQMMPLPIQPEWVMETLGLGTYVADRYKLEPDGPKTIRLVEKATSPQGMPMRKVIVMNKNSVRAPTPQVTAFLLQDDRTGQEICSAHILTTRQDPITGAIVPHKLELRVPSQKMSMVLKLDGAKVNGQIAPTAFQRQPMTGVEPFNIATRQVEPWGMQRTQGFNK